MDEPGNRRSLVYRIATLVAVAAVLAAVAFLLRGGGRAAGTPLYLEDSLTAWRSATPEEKLATAEMLLDYFEREGVFGPKTKAAFENPRRQGTMAEELVAGLNKAAQGNLSEYVPPTEQIQRTASRVAALNGWGQ